MAKKVTVTFEISDDTDREEANEANLYDFFHHMLIAQLAERPSRAVIQCMALDLDLVEVKVEEA